MFTELSPESSVKQPVTFLASVCLQFAALAVLCCLPPPPGTGAYLRSSAVRENAVTPIYFYKEQEPATPVPVAARPAPEMAQAKVQTKAAVTAPAPTETAPAATVQEASAQAAGADDGSASGDGQGIAPFPAWRMNAMTGFNGMHHQMKTALPVFTPDPPILHAQVPEQARGKDVVMEVMIDDQGSVVYAQVVQGVGGGVEQSIVETLRRWIFIPAKFNGVAMPSQRQLTFHLPS
jgi:TonB family protein